MNVKQIKARLEKAGWEYIGSVMNDSSNENFGLCFVNDGETFWLNFRTYNNLPDGV